MGNHSSSHHEPGEQQSSHNTNSAGISGKQPSRTSSDANMTRSPSGADINEKNFSQYVPIEKLSQILHSKTQSQFGVNGIVCEIFVTQLFPNYSDLGTRIFKQLHANSRAKTKHLGTVAFKQQCERYLALMDDNKILEVYVKLYGEPTEDPEKPDFITSDGVKRLLLTCYSIAMAHSTGNGVGALCPQLDRTLNSVVKSIFFSQDSLSLGFVSRWFEQNAIRLVLLVHKYCVHTLTTAYRGLEQSDGFDGGSGLELSTPVLDIKNPFSDSSSSSTSDAHSHKIDDSLMPLSQAWLLAGTLPPLYSRPQAVSSPTANKSTSSAVQIFKNKLAMIPSHWALLYDSDDHGVGANRFLHHVLGYRGPTLVLLHTRDDQTYLIASPNEWKETHLYTGSEGCVVIQLLPKFVILEKKPNILYLNTSIRGYPKGLRAGADPRKPILSVDEHFEKIDIKGIQHELISIEVSFFGHVQYHRTS
ncbi:hypothetical protein ACFFRR_011353 [Megaselia abdita]